MLARVTKAAGVDLLIWSGLESIPKISGGKYTLADHFESKAAITEYARQSGVPLAVVQAGSYASNFIGLLVPRKQADGSFVVAVPFGSSTVLPVIDMVQDYGIFVREAIESPAFGPDSEILTYGELITVGDCVSQLAEITGKKISCVELSNEEFIAAFPFPRHVATEMLDSLCCIEEFGYYGKKDVKSSQQDLARKPRTWAEFARATDWTTILA